MAFSEEKLVITCSACGAINEVTVRWSGDDRANEREKGECARCRTVIHSERCGMILTKLVGKGAP